MATTIATAAPPTVVEKTFKDLPANDTLILPTDVELTYLTEGGANVLYRLRSSPCADFPAHTLLRMRKTLPTAAPNATQYRYLVTTALPLLPEKFRLKVGLVQIPTVVIERENARLRELEKTGRRKPKRHGMYLEAQEKYGFLIGDMSPQTRREVLVEFKPKWLVQSPSAPKDARRCRTCALRTKRHGSAPGFCPMDLASGCPERIRRAVRYLLPKDAPEGFEFVGEWGAERKRLEDHVVKFLSTSEVIPGLVKLQERLDPNGPLEDPTPDFLNAMTVRDLTLFLRVDMDTGKVECGVGDLDMKSDDNGRGEYWRKTERDLIEGGWYTGDPPCQL